MELVQDDRKQAVQSFQRKRGGKTVLDVTTADPVVFSPSIQKRTSYLVRSSQDIMLARHGAGYAFDYAGDTEPECWSSEEQLVVLDPQKYPSLTMQAIAADSRVTITEVD